MSNAFLIIRENISIWWAFMWSTYLPGCNFTFGHLYTFVMCFSIFISILSIILNRKEDAK